MSQLYQIQNFQSMMFEEQKRLCDELSHDNTKTDLIKELEVVNKLIALITKYKQEFKEDKKGKSRLFKLFSYILFWRRSISTRFWRRSISTKLYHNWLQLIIILINHYNKLMKC